MNAKGLSYAIFSQPRTGSTLLSELLRGRGLGNPLEYLNETRIGSFWPSHRPFELDRYIELLKETQAAPTGWFGIKVHYSQLHARLRMPAAIRSFVVSFDKIIVLNRGNKLAQAISALKADQTGRWNAAVPETGSEPDFEPATIAENIRRFLYQDRQIAEMRLADSRPVLSIGYENLRDALPETWDAVQTFLGVAPEPVDPTMIRSQPQRDGISLDFERRFLDIIQGRA